MHATDDDETDPVTIITTELGGRPLDPLRQRRSRETDALYTSGDLNVLPPTIVRPVIPPPPAPNAPPESMALFDVGGRPAGAVSSRCCWPHRRPGSTSG